MLIALFIGISQLGLGFYAAAGMKHAVAEGARYATIFPRPSNAQIIAKINAEAFGLTRGTVTGPTVVECNASGQPCLDIAITFSIPLKFAFVSLPPVTMDESRRVFVSPTS